MAETTIAIDLRVLWQGFGPARAETGSILSVEAVDRHGSHVDVIGADVTFYGIDSIAIDSLTGELQVQVPVTDGTFCIRWVIATPRGQRLERFTVVPASPDPVAFGDLQQVRREDFAPAPEIVAAWEAVTAEVAAARDSAAASATSAGANADRAVDAAAAADERADDADSHAVAAAASAATALSAEAGASDSASAAAASEGAAAASAAAAGGSAGAAAGSASDASSDAAAADASRRAAADSESNAADSASDAAGSSTDAAGSATSAGISATSAADSATLAGSSAGTASADAAAAMQARLDASGFATTASAASVNAEASRVAAEAARADAETARTGAEAAKAGAETARTGAQAAQTASETARNAAQTAAQNATSATYAGQLISTAVDLNTLTRPGQYRLQAVHNLALNAPTDSFIGSMSVYARDGDQAGNNSTRLIQIAYPQAGGAAVGVAFYMRVNSSTGWSPWRIVATQSTSAPANQPGTEVRVWNDSRNVEISLTPTSIYLATNNLDVVILPGSYYAGIADAVVSRNYPVPGGSGILEVFAIAQNEILQRYTMHGGVTGFTRNVYARRRTSAGAWSSWEKVSGLKITQGANQPGPLVNLWDDVSLKDQIVPLTGVPLGTSDLNGVVTAGSYVQTNTANATLAANYPVASANGVLEVRVLLSSAITQEYTPHNGNAAQAGRVSYRRSLASGTWSPWRAVATQRVDTTAGRAIYTYDDVRGGEQLIYGDTGWRDITSLLLNGATATLAAIRRVGSNIYARFTSLQLPSTATGDPIYTLPSGFQAAASTYGILRENVATGNAYGFQLSGNINLSANVSQTPQPNNTNHRFTGTLVSVVDQAWPTSLPGSAYGAIPSA